MNVSFDCKDMVAELERFRSDCEEMAQNAEKEGRLEIAELNRKYAKSFAGLVKEITR